MNAKWPKAQLEDLVTLQRGHDLPSRKRGDGGVPVMGSSGITGYHDEAKALGPGVVVGRSGASYGSVTYVKEDFWPLNTSLYVIDFHGNDARFAYYFLQSMDFDAYNTGSAQPSLNRNLIHPIEISLPPLPVQRRIADILGALDDKIELNRRMNRTLEDMAQALYRHWFVDFGPFQDQPFVDSELGPIPEGWEVKTVGETCDINLGQSPKSDYYNEEGEGLPFHQGVSSYGWRFPVHERHCTKPKRVAEDADILISVRAPVGRLNIADRKLIIGRGLTALRRNDNRQSFLLAYLKDFFDEEDKIGSGTVFNSITKKVLQGLTIIQPPEKVLSEFEEVVGEYDALIRSNSEEINTLAETRDYLLPKLISGEISVDAAEEEAKAAA
jgi:type I restriction enzyme S subunit